MVFCSFTVGGGAGGEETQLIRVCLHFNARNLDREQLRIVFHNFHGRKETVQWPDTALVNGRVCLSGQMSASPGRLIAFIVRCTWLDSCPQRRKPWPLTLASPFSAKQILFSSYWLAPEINKPATPGPLHLQWPISLQVHVCASSLYASN